MLTDQQVYDFQQEVWDYFRLHQRQMPWRDDPTPYHVVVSELMLQQTQVGRVLPKYQQFVAQFPDWESLAQAPLAQVLGTWSGLGYNRRAKFLHQAAQMVAQDYGGQLPSALDQLVKLPGVGRNTAGAVLAYAYDQPVVFVETNIRTVFFHHFFANQHGIDDKEILPLVEQTLDREHPRQWYWALMDYGTYLKQTQGNNISRSRHYARQSKFEGSRRQVRGAVLRALLRGPLSKQQLADMVSDDRLSSVVDDLTKEGMIEHMGEQIRLTGSPKLR